MGSMMDDGMAGTGLLLHTESLKTFPHDDAHRACAQHRSAPHLLAEALSDCRSRRYRDVWIEMSWGGTGFHHSWIPH
jgi:hypothetical protein